MAESIVFSIVEKLARFALNPIRCQFKYMLCYDSKIKTLRDKVKDLGIKEIDVQELVVKARRNAEAIKPDVTDWLKKVDDLKKQAEEVLESATNSEMHCLFHTCPNLKTRYSLGRKATKKTVEVDKLLEKVTLYQNVGEPKPLVQPPYQNPRDFGAFETRMSTKKGIMEALKNNDVSIIGICGMAGVGKTTMAKEIANQVKVDKLFDEVAIAVVSQDPDVTKIQGQLAEMLGLRIEEKYNEIVRAGRLRDRLGVDASNSVLIILDDVWECIELGNIGIPLAGDDKRLKILLTSRFEDVCSNMGAQRKFDINVLNEEESWELFKEKAEISDDETEVLKCTAEKVARECNGLPLALVTVGRALSKKAEHVWDNALKELQNSSVTSIRGMHKLVYSRIEFSINYLESDEAKSVLMLFSLLPEDLTITIGGLVGYAWGLNLLRGTNTLSETRNRLNSIVDNLISCYLLLSDEVFLKLHDVVRDVCLQIASKDKHAYLSKHTGLKEWPKDDNNESYSAISLTSTELDQFPGGLEYPNLKLLGVTCQQQSVDISREFFAGLKELRVLDFTDMRIQIPSSIQLLTNLRTLCLYECKLNIDISTIGNLKKLEFLSFLHSHLDHFPSGIAELSNLRSLDLRFNYSSSYCTLPPGIFLKLKKLEELFMGVIKIRDDELERPGYIIEEISSLAGLNNFQISTNDPQFLLQILHVLCIEKLERFDILLADLESPRGYTVEDYYFRRKLHIGGITDVSMLSQPAMNLLMRRTDCLSIEMGMDNFDDLSLQVLEGKKMSDEDGFEYLNGNHPTEAVDRLRMISLRGMPRMKHLWRGVFKPPSFHNLMILKIEFCPSVKSLFSESGALCMVNLQNLSISMLEEIVSTDTEQSEITQMLEFPKLQKISLEHLRNFKSFRSGSNKLVSVHNPLFKQNYELAFPSLKFLRIGNCPAMTKFCSSQSAPKLDKVWINSEQSPIDISNFMDSEGSIYMRR